MSINQITKRLIEAGIIWRINTVSTQPVGAPTSMGVIITIPEGERGLLLGGFIGPDNYGAARQCDAFLRRSGSAQTKYHLGGDSVDNQRIQLCPILTSITETAITQQVLGVPYMPFILTELEQIVLLGTTLANAETLSLEILIATRIVPPTRAAQGAGVTLTTDDVIQV